MNFFFPGLCTPFIHTGDTTTSLIIGLFEFSHHHHRKTLWNSKFYIRNHSLHVWNWECHYRDLCLVSRFQAPYSSLAGNRYVCKSKKYYNMYFVEKPEILGLLEKKKIIIIIFFCFPLRMSGDGHWVHNIFIAAFSFRAIYGSWFRWELYQCQYLSLPQAIRSNW